MLRDRRYEDPWGLLYPELLACSERLLEGATKPGVPRAPETWELPVMIDIIVEHASTPVILQSLRLAPPAMFVDEFRTGEVGGVGLLI